MLKIGKEKVKLMSKKFVAVYLCILTIVGAFIAYPYIGLDKNDDKSILKLVSLKDDTASSIILAKEDQNMMAVLYQTSNNEEKLMLFKDNEYYGGSEIADDLGVYYSRNESTLYVVFGKVEDEINSYEYEISNRVIFVGECANNYVLDIYMIDEEDDLGHGKAYDVNGAIQFEF